MAVAIGVRSNHTSTDLRWFARRSENPDQVRRLLAVPLILDGGSLSEAAKVGGLTLQIMRDWVKRFNEGGPDSLVTRKAPGRAFILNDEQRSRLAGGRGGTDPCGVRRGALETCRSGALDPG